MLGIWSGEIGLSPSEFWRQTPRTFAAIVEGFGRRLEAEHNGRAWLVWHGEALHRVKKLPKLRDMLGRKRKPKRRQTPEEMMAAATAWHTAINR
ncbi:hypothetical protein ATO13_23191 [Stappia sp. 22II-S9-Z10]|nr:hypothetical protein ATO13_23191 [Stappia sp. 22II-S9-Z10]